MKHHRQEHVAGLDFKEARAAGREKGLEELKRSRPMLRQDVELEDRWLVLPRPADRHRAETDGDAAQFEKIGERPAFAPVDRVMDNLATRLLAIARAQREDALDGGLFGLNSHKNRSLPVHSVRSAAMGFSFAARRAATKHARKIESASNRTPLKVLN